MWVRSQDKTRLVKCDAFEIVFSQGTSYSVESYNLIGTCNGEEYYLGTYKNKGDAINCIDGLYQRMHKGISNDIPYQID